MTGEKVVPTGVKVISIFGIIISSLAILAGLCMLIIAVVNPIGDNPLGVVIGPFLFIPGVIGLALSIFLLKLKSWARIVIIALSFMGLAGNLMSVVTLILRFNWIYFLILVVSCAIELVLALYLLLNKKVKGAFK